MGRTRRCSTSAWCCPFLIDLAGNAAGAYDSITWWDDAMHVVTWVPLVVALGLLLGDARLAFGAGAVAAILWEIAEYFTFVADHPVESMSAYRDTVGDLTGSLTGSALGALLLVALSRRRPEKRAHRIGGLFPPGGHEVTA